MPTVAGNASGHTRFVVVGMAVITALFAGATAGTSAHEPRTTPSGNYTMTVGFVNEPAYLGLENGLYLNVVQIGGANDPVPDLQDTLQAEVIFGGNSMPLTFAPIPEAPGQYVASFLPTRTGDYTFRITGTIGEETVSEEFRSSPDTFDSVQPATLIQFPDPVPAGSDLTTALSNAEDDASGARTLAYVGIGVGVLGVLIALAALGLVARKRPV